MTEEELPLVSVITPSLNQGRFIEETILSIRNQDYPRLEHIVVDGGSTDGTLEILRRYDHLIWVSEPDRGQADAVNKGFRLAKGEILGWLNADDTYMPGAVAAAVNSLRTRPDVDIVYGDCNEVDEEGRLLRTMRGRPFDLHGLLLLEYDIYQPTVFLRRRVVEMVGLLDIRLQLAMDYNYWVRAGRVCRLQYIGETWASFRVHRSAKMAARTRDILPDHLLTLDMTFSDPTLPSGITRGKREAYSNAYLFGGVRSYESRARKEARARLLQSLRLYPHPLRAKTLKAILLLFDTALGIGVGNWVVQRLHFLTVR